jgi:hypothetical protein
MAAKKTKIKKSTRDEVTQEFEALIKAMAVEIEKLNVELARLIAATNPAPGTQPAHAKNPDPVQYRNESSSSSLEHLSNEAASEMQQNLLRRLGFDYMVFSGYRKGQLISHVKGHPALVEAAVEETLNDRNQALLTKAAAEGATSLVEMVKEMSRKAEVNARG